MNDPKLRDSEFNPIDDFKLASGSGPTMDRGHRVVTLFDRYAMAVVQGLLASPNTLCSVEMFPRLVSEHAIAMLEERARLFGVKEPP